MIPLHGHPPTPPGRKHLVRASGFGYKFGNQVILSGHFWYRAHHRKISCGVHAAGVVPSATFETKEGKYVIIGGNGDSIYTRLMTAVGRPDMFTPPPPFYLTYPPSAFISVKLQHRWKEAVEIFVWDRE